MRNSNAMWGLIAGGVVFLWAAVAVAQSRSANADPLGRPTQKQNSSTIMSPLICDSSGKVCIAVGKRRSSAPVESPRSPNAASSVPIAAPSASPFAAPEIAQSKQTRVICDPSGKICVSGQQARALTAGKSSLIKGKGTASASRKSSPITPVLLEISPKALPGAHADESGSADNATQKQIDGISIYDALTSDDPFSWVVRVYKSQHRLEVYFKGHLYRTYHAVFGRSLGAGAKLWEGDRRTPEGNYLIVGKHPSARFGWFLHLNYPNERDHERFEQSRAANLIPASAHEGGQIGIHGTDSPYLNVAEVDWTTGCISVDNPDIRELARLLPVGTLVIINP